MRRVRGSRTGNRNRVLPGRGALVRGDVAAAGTASWLQQQEAGKQAQPKTRDPAAPPASSANPQSSEAQASNRQPGRVERGAAEQAPAIHGTGDGLNVERGRARSGAVQRDCRVGEGRSGSSHDRGRRRVTHRDGAVVALGRGVLVRRQLDDKAGLIAVLHGQNRRVWWLHYEVGDVVVLGGAVVVDGSRR